jgi:hypothetical protein
MGQSATLSHFADMKSFALYMIGQLSGGAVFIGHYATKEAAMKEGERRTGELLAQPFTREVIILS